MRKCILTYQNYSLSNIDIIQVYIFRIIKTFYVAHSCLIFFQTSICNILNSRYVYAILLSDKHHLYLPHLSIFCEAKSCILKLFYINTVYNLLSNYTFRLLIRWWWWLITSVYPSPPKSFMHPLILIFAGVTPGDFNLFNKAFIQIKLDSLTLRVKLGNLSRHCKVGSQYALYLWKQSHFSSNETNFDINISDCIRNYTCSN